MLVCTQHMNMDVCISLLILRKNYSLPSDFVALTPTNMCIQREDGGWGLHILGPSTMFGSVLNYVSLRLMGEGPSDGDGAMEKGRAWILANGSATATPQWGKIWISVLIINMASLYLLHFFLCSTHFSSLTYPDDFSFLDFIEAAWLIRLVWKQPDDSRVVACPTFPSNSSW